MSVDRVSASALCSNIEQRVGAFITNQPRKSVGGRL